MLPPFAFRLEQSFRDQASEGDEEYQSAIPEVRRIRDFVQQAFLARSRDIPLPNKGQRFRAAQDVDVTAVVYWQHEMCPVLLIPIATEPYTLTTGEIVILPYQPNRLHSVACHVIPERYVELEKEVVKPNFRMDKLYLGYAFSVWYDTLYSQFLWL